MERRHGLEPRTARARVGRQVDGNEGMVDQVLADAGQVDGDVDADVSEVVRGPIPDRARIAGLA